MYGIWHGGSVQLSSRIHNASLNNALCECGLFEECFVAAESLGYLQAFVFKLGSGQLKIFPDARIQGIHSPVKGYCSRGSELPFLLTQNQQCSSLAALYQNMPCNLIKGWRVHMHTAKPENVLSPGLLCVCREDGEEK